MCGAINAAHITPLSFILGPQVLNDKMNAKATAYVFQSKQIPFLYQIFRRLVNR